MPQVDRRSDTELDVMVGRTVVRLDRSREDVSLLFGPVDAAELVALRLSSGCISEDVSERLRAVMAVWQRSKEVPGHVSHVHGHAAMKSFGYLLWLGHGGALQAHARHASGQWSTTIYLSS